MNALNKEIKESLLHQGAAIVGFADLSDLPPDIRDGYRYGISIAVELNPEIVTKIGNGPCIEYDNEYNGANILLNQLAESCSNFLKTRGFEALAKAHVKIDEATKRSKLPHKTVATKAGLGWIGKCALLVTEEYGAGIRITSVLTNADLNVGVPITESRCGDCMECKKICSAGAVTGIQWKPGMNRDELFKFESCNEKIEERGKMIGSRHGSCGLCIWACPWTQKHLKSSLKS